MISFHSTRLISPNVFSSQVSLPTVNTRRYTLNNNNNNNNNNKRRVRRGLIGLRVVVRQDVPAPATSARHPAPRTRITVASRPIFFLNENTKAKAHKIERTKEKKNQKKRPSMWKIFENEEQKVPESREVFRFTPVRLEFVTTVCFMVNVVTSATHGQRHQTTSTTSTTKRNDLRVPASFYYVVREREREKRTFFSFFFDVEHSTALIGTRRRRCRLAKDESVRSGGCGMALREAN